MRRCFPAIAILALAAMSCTPASSSDLIGTWTISDDSRELLARPPGADSSARMVLREEGTVDYHDIPGELFGREGTVTGRGEWSMDEGRPGIGGVLELLWEGRQTVNLTLSDVSEGDPSNIPFRTGMRVGGGEGGRSLYFFIGDPDSGKRVVFSQRGVDSAASG